MPAHFHVYSECWCVRNTRTSASNTVLARRWYSLIHLEQSVYAVQFSDDRLKQLKHETNSDPEVTALRDIITDDGRTAPSNYPIACRRSGPARMNFQWKTDSY